MELIGDNNTDKDCQLVRKLLISVENINICNAVNPTDADLVKTTINNVHKCSADDAKIPHCQNVSLSTSCELERRALKVIWDDDLEAFKALFINQRDELIYGCFRIQSMDGPNLLIEALSQQNDNDIAEYLLDDKKIVKSILQPNDDKSIAFSHLCLITLAENGKHILARKLIDKGERRNSALTRSGWTKARKTYTFDMMGVAKPRALSCLQVAAMNGHFKFIDLLASLELIFTYPGDESELNVSAKYLAIRFGHVEALQRLCHHCVIEEWKETHSSTAQFSPLHVAVCYNKVEITKFLLRESECKDISTGGCLGYPIAFAAALGYTDIVDTLLEVGGEASNTSAGDEPVCCALRTAIHAAAAIGRTETLRCLLDFRGDGGDSNGETSTTVLRLECEDELGNTPLLVATYGGHLSTVELLLSLGASATHRNKLGHGIWQLICAPRNKRNAEALLGLFRRHNILLHMDSLTETQAAVEAAISSGIPFFENDPRGNTLVHQAAINKDTNTLRFFLPEYEMLTGRKNLLGETPLHLAAARNNVESVEILLQFPSSLTAVDNDGFMPLHVAAKSGNVNVVEMIANVVDQQAECSSLDSKGNDGHEPDELLTKRVKNTGDTASHIAAREGHTEVVKLLLDRSPSLCSARNKEGYTCLHVAAEGGYADTAKTILNVIQSSAKLSSRSRIFDAVEAAITKTKCGKTPPLLAAENGHVEVIHVFARYPLCLKYGDVAQQTPMHVAAILGHNDVVEALLAAAKWSANPADTTVDIYCRQIAMITMQDMSGDTALHLAARHGSLEVVNRLLKFPECLTVLDNRKSTALHEAALGGHVEVLKSIIRAAKSKYAAVASTADVKDVVDAVSRRNRAKSLIDALVRFRNSPRCSAAEQTELFEPRVTFSPLATTDDADEASSDETDDELWILSAQNVVGRTALHIAAATGHSACVLELLQWVNGRQTFVADKQGRTALHVAAFEGRADTVAVLLQNAISGIVCENDRNKCGGRTRSVVNRSDSMGNTAVQLACSGGHLEVVRAFARYFPDSLFFANARKRTALHAAAESGHDVIVNIILHLAKSCRKVGEHSRLAEVICQQDKNGETALHLAVRNGRLKAVKILLKNTDRLDVRDANGLVPLHVAAQIGNTTALQMIMSRCEQLHGNKDDMLEMEDLCGNTPMHLLASRGHVEAMLYLLPTVATPGFVTKNKNSFMPLHVAVQKSDAEIVRRMADALRAVDKFQAFVECSVEGTALHLAIRNERTECFEALLEGCAASARFVELRGKRPLHYAAESDNFKVIESYLLASRNTFSEPEDMDAVDSRGQTALMYCVAGCDVERFKLLAKHGANPRWRNKTGCNLMHYAIEQYQQRPLVRPAMFAMFQFLKGYNLERNEGYCAIESRLIREKLTPVKLAAAVGAVELFQDLVACYAVLRFEDAIVYRMNGLVPEQIHSSRAKKENSKSCMELIADYCSYEEISAMLMTDSLRLFIRRFAKIRSAAFYVIFFVHILYMCCFSAFVIPTCGQSENATNSTSRTKPPVNHLFAAFVVWPAVLLFFEALCFFKFARRLLTGRTPLKWWNGVKFYTERTSCGTLSAHWHNAGHRLKRFVSDDQTHTSSYIQYFEVFSHLVSFTVGVVIIAWFVMYFAMETRGKLYVDVVAVAQIIGWLNAIDYLKGFSGMFTVMLKVIFIKDVIRILFIYSFVLVGFSLAIYAYVLTETSWNDVPVDMYNIAYNVFGTMLGMGDLFGISTQHDSQFHVIMPTVIRAIFVVYLCLSTIMLLNILIAMMNRTYEDVLGLTDTLWCVEGLRFVSWVSQDNALGIRTLCRSIADRFIFDKTVVDRYRLGIAPNEPLVVSRIVRENVHKVEQRNKSTFAESFLEPMSKQSLMFE